jgi:DNA-binding transcriptional LysR family regulator
MSRESELGFFATLVKAGSLTAAARELDVTPPAISKRLAQLEARLGVRLLHRTTRRISLTHEGQVYMEHAGRILGDIEQMERDVSSARKAPKGLLRVNAPLGFGRTYISPLISEFARAYPDVEVQLVLSDHPLILADESIDVGIRFGDLPDARIIARRVAPNRRLICAAPAYLQRHGKPGAPEDLAQHNCLILRQNDVAPGIWRFTHGRKTHTVKVRGTLSSNDGEVVLKWALDGHGIVQRAEWDIARYVRSGRLRLLLEDYALPPADIFAVYHERHHLSAKVKVFLEFLVSRFRKSGNGSGGMTW